MSHQTTGVKDATGSNNVNITASKGRLRALAQVNAFRNKDAGGDITSVAAAFTALCADDINASRDGLRYMLGGADHLNWQGGEGATDMQLIQL
jgi:hypothetical protein